MLYSYNSSVIKKKQSSKGDQNHKILQRKVQPDLRSQTYIRAMNREGNQTRERESKIFEWKGIGSYIRLK